MHNSSARTFSTSRYTHRLKIGLIMLLAGMPAAAEELQVIEMFTSQGCYSCPAADQLLAEMAANDANILNLEFHVDYWNQLQYRSQGNWEDPFSKAEYSNRQRQYHALNLRGRNGVYTPQAVINGIYGEVGSNRHALTDGLNIENPRPVSVNIEHGAEQFVDITIENQGQTEAEIFFVSFLKKTSTNITSGENHDKIMENHNVVVDMRSIGSLSDAAESPIRVAFAGGENRGCAVLIQPARQGAIIGAARCP